MFGGKCELFMTYSKTPIYRGVWGKGNIRGKSGSSVNRCYTLYTSRAREACTPAGHLPVYRGFTCISGFYCITYQFKAWQRALLICGCSRNVLMLLLLIVLATAQVTLTFDEITTLF